MHMRNKLMIWTAALLCSAPLAHAQQAATSEEPAGIADFGVRAGTTEGDEARYERYQDLRNGVFSRIQFGKVTDQSILNLGASNIGYRDQNYYAQLHERQVEDLGILRLHAHSTTAT